MVYIWRHLVKYTSLNLKYFIVIINNSSLFVDLLTPAHSLFCCYFSAHLSKWVRTLCLSALCVCVCACVWFLGTKQKFPWIRSFSNPGYLEKPRLWGIWSQEQGHSDDFLRRRTKKAWNQMPRLRKERFKLVGRAVEGHNSSQVCVRLSRSSVHNFMSHPARKRPGLQDGGQWCDPWESGLGVPVQPVTGAAELTTSRSTLHFTVIRIHISISSEGPWSRSFRVTEIKKLSYLLYNVNIV